MNKIDFVITWVDGADPKWLKEKSQYTPDKDNDANINRYRDWDLLKYWFRIELSVFSTFITVGFGDFNNLSIDSLYSSMFLCCILKS